MQGDEKAGERDHTSALNTVNNLRLLFVAQGKPKQAEAIRERALQGYKKALVPASITNIPASNSFKNLTALYIGLGHTSEGFLGSAPKWRKCVSAGKMAVLSSLS